jgi:hypothetical protein
MRSCAIVFCPWRARARAGPPRSRGATHHGVSLGHAVDDERAILQAWLDRRNGCKFAAVEDHMLVEIVGDNSNARMAQQHVGKRGQFCARIERAAGIGRVVDDEPARARRDRGFERLRAELEAVVLRTGHGDRNAVRGGPVFARLRSAPQRRGAGAGGCVPFGIAITSPPRYPHAPSAWL